MNVARILGLGLIGVGAWLAKRYADRVDSLGERLVTAVQGVTGEIHKATEELRKEMNVSLGSLRNEMHEMSNKMETGIKEVSKSLADHKLDVEQRFLKKDDFKDSITRVHERLDGSMGRNVGIAPIPAKRRSTDTE